MPEKKIKFCKSQGQVNKKYCKSARFTARNTLKGLSSALTIGLVYTPYKLRELSISVRRFACPSEDVYMISRNVWQPAHNCWCRVRCCLLMRLLNSTFWNFQLATLQLSTELCQ